MKLASFNRIMARRRALCPMLIIVNAFVGDIHQVGVNDVASSHGKWGFEASPTRAASCITAPRITPACATLRIRSTLPSARSKAD